ncbi:MAG: ATP-binding protein [Proteobacteria bacterium]|nr:ATP-binding protein [Pseudomonadota bacterium]
MNRLLKIARSVTPGTGVQFCEEAYGSEGIRQFLRDVLAMANATVGGNRYIITGIRFDGENLREVSSVDLEDFSGTPFYSALVAEFIEPPIPISYRAVIIEGQRVGVYEIGDCQDKPYMMRVDYSEQLRRGDAYMRVDSSVHKIGRRILFSMFDKRPTNVVLSHDIEVGFSGEVIQKKLRLPTVDMTTLPSAIEHAKLHQLVDAREKSKDSGSTTTMARMVHMRLFGSDDPYEDRSPTRLIAEMEQTRQKHESDDYHFLFKENSQLLQLVVYNQGDEPVQNAALMLLLPNHEAFYVATGLTSPDNSVEFAEYPAVSVSAKKITVSSILGDLPIGSQTNAFELPLRFCAGTELNEKQMTIRYKLFGSNLGQPVEGELSLIFYSDQRHQETISSEIDSKDLPQSTFL